MSYKYNDNGEKEYLQKEYTQKYYKDLFFGLLNKAHENGLISHNELFTLYVNSRQDISSFYVMTLSILSDSIEDVYYDMTDVYRSNKILYAIGNDLDEIGLIVGCPRPQATKSSVLLRFRLGRVYNEPVLIPAGISVTSINQVSYTTVESAVVPSGEVEFEVYALADITGVKSRVGANSLTKLNTDVMYNNETLSLSVTNPYVSSGGMEAFTDDEYRELLMDWVKAKIKGSKEAYELYFSNMNGLDSYKLIPNWNGVTGTLKIVLDPGTPAQLQQAYDDINLMVSQFSEDITLHPPKLVPISIYAYVDVDIDRLNPYSSTEKAEIKSRIEEAIKIYINGDLYNEDRLIYRGLNIGEDFIPHQLGVFITNVIPEVKNIQFKYPVKPITITDEELATIDDSLIEVDMSGVQLYNEIDTDDDGVADYIGYSLKE